MYQCLTEGSRPLPAPDQRRIHGPLDLELSSAARTIWGEDLQEKASVPGQGSVVWTAGSTHPAGARAAVSHADVEVPEDERVGRAALSALRVGRDRDVSLLQNVRNLVTQPCKKGVSARLVCAVDKIHGHGLVLWSRR